MVTALAALATAAGKGRRDMALQMVDRLADERRDGRLSRTTPEHIHKVIEELKQIPESQNRATSNPTHAPLTRSQASNHTVKADNSAPHAAASDITSREKPAHDAPAPAPDSTPIQRPKRALSPSPAPSLDTKKPKLDDTEDLHPPIPPPPVVYKPAEPDQPSTTAKSKHDANNPAEETHNTLVNPANEHRNTLATAAATDHDDILARLTSTQHQLTHAQHTVDTLTLDLSLTQSALASATADAASWRALEPGYRHCLAENMRLSRAELRAERAEVLVAALRGQMREVEGAYARLEAEKVDVWGEADGVVRERDGLRRECEGLRGEVERLRGRGGG